MASNNVSTVSTVSAFIEGAPPGEVRNGPFLSFTRVLLQKKQKTHLTSLFFPSGS